MTHKHIISHAAVGKLRGALSAPVRVTLALSLAAALASCGGGNDVSVGDPLVGGSEVPTSATTSAAGAFAFVKSVADASSETAEPLRVSDATLGASETDEPQPL